MKRHQWEGRTAILRMVEFSEQSALDVLAVLHRLAKVEHRRRRHGIDARGQFHNFLAGLVCHPFEKYLVNLVSSVLQALERRKAGVNKQVFPTNHCADVVPLVRRRRREGDVSVLARQRCYWVAASTSPSSQPDTGALANDAIVLVRHESELVQRRQCLHLGEFDRLSFARHFAGAQCKHQPCVSLHSGQALRLVARQHQRLSVFLAAEIKISAERKAHQR